MERLDGFWGAFIPDLGSSMPTLDGRRNILIVDDDPAVGESLRMLVSRQGHQARVARSAEEAVELIALWQPDLALLDVMLPGISGIEFAKQLRVAHPACQIVLISGHPGTKELLEFPQPGEDPLQILAKPVDPELIVALAAGESRLGQDAGMP